MKKYELEIYSPNTVLDTMASIESDSPFMTISVGDLVNPRLWTTHDVEGILKVTKIEHMIWETDGIAKHKICVYTTELPDTEDSRKK